MLHNLEFDDFTNCELLIPPGCFGEDKMWQNTVQGRFMVYCDALCQVHERGIALHCFEKLTEAVPDWKPELEAAMDEWRECSSYGSFLWKHLTNDNAGLEKFRTPEIRRILADEGQRSMDCDVRAVEHIEKLLNRIG